MADVVTLDALKGQVRIDPDDGSEDALLVPILAAAVRAVENRTGRVFEGDSDTIGAADVPAANMAVLMLAAHWYRNRETVVVGASPAELPMGVEYLITPFAKMGV